MSLIGEALKRKEEEEPDSGSNKPKRTLKSLKDIKPSIEVEKSSYDFRPGSSSEPVKPKIKLKKSSEGKKQVTLPEISYTTPVQETVEKNEQPCIQSEKAVDQTQPQEKVTEEKKDTGKQQKVLYKGLIFILILIVGTTIWTGRMYLLDFINFISKPSVNSADSSPKPETIESQKVPETKIENLEQQISSNSKETVVADSTTKIDSSSTTKEKDKSIKKYQDKTDSVVRAELINTNIEIKSPLEAEIQWPSITVNAIVGKGLQGSAMLNNNIVSIGESYLGVKLIEIKDGGVVLEYNGQKKFVRQGMTTQ